MKKALEKNGIVTPKTNVMRMTSIIKADEWPIPEIDYEDDAVTYMQKA